MGAADRLRAPSSGALPLEEIMRAASAARPTSASSPAAPEKIAVLVWHYHDDDVAGPDAAVTLGSPASPPEWKSTLRHSRIDQHHSNAYGEWGRMGSPIAPDPAQYAALQQASELATLEGSPTAIGVAGGKATVAFTLPRQGVSLVVVRWP